jgi:prophage regulatory protein
MLRKWGKKWGKFHMRIMRLKEVIEKTGLSRSTIYNWISQGKFPKQIDLGARSVGWVDTEVDEWLSLRIELRDSTTIS